MTPGAPVAEDVFGQLAAMRVIAGSVTLGSPPREPILEKGSDLMVRGRVEVDALSWHE